MLESAPTLGSVETSTYQKRQNARQSLDYNMRDPVFQKLFPDYVEMHEKEMAARGTTASANGNAAQAMSDSAAGAGALLRRNDRLEMQGLMATVAGLFAILSIVLAMRFI